jgi:hypothetical protein
MSALICRRTKPKASSYARIAFIRFRHRQLSTTISLTVRNIYIKLRDTHVNIEDILQLSFRHYNISKRVPYSDIQVATANCLIELLACRDGALQLSHSDFNIRDVITLIDCICTC